MCPSGTFRCPVLKKLPWSQSNQIFMGRNREMKGAEVLLNRSQRFRVWDVLVAKETHLIGHADLDLWPPTLNSAQFILKSDWMFVPHLEKFHRGFQEILLLQKWAGRKNLNIKDKKMWFWLNMELESRKNERKNLNPEAAFLHQGWTFFVFFVELQAKMLKLVLCITQRWIICWNVLESRGWSRSPPKTSPKSLLNSFFHYFTSKWTIKLMLVKT